MRPLPLPWRRGPQLGRAIAEEGEGLRHRPPFLVIHERLCELGQAPLLAFWAAERPLILPDATVELRSVVVGQRPLPVRQTLDVGPRQSLQRGDVGLAGETDR